MDERIYKSVMESWIDISIILFIIFFGINYYLISQPDRFLFIPTIATSFVVLTMLAIMIKSLFKTILGKLLFIVVAISIIPTLCFFLIEGSREYLNVTFLKTSFLIGGIGTAIIGISRKIKKYQ